ncbi:MAG: acetyl-CoA carboxylase biotin carboxylase subunit [Longimicrobiales bacterium]
MLSKVLIANRGEIAVRVIRACRELGVRSVAVYSDADRLAPHVLLADEAYRIGESPSAASYLRADALIETALRCGCDAIHPGYGFLSERAFFAAAVERAGLVFIGPAASAIAAMGDKTEARRRMTAAGVPVVPGLSEPLADVPAARDAANGIGYPVLLKAAAGGGGKGMRVVQTDGEMKRAFEAASHEAKSSFGDASVYLEKYLERPRHIEVQILADAHGAIVHLGERECSIQRRHQKLVEEAPSSILTPEQRDAMGRAAVAAAAAVGYRNAGTIEFLWQDGSFHFLEMNTRIQVEHPVTELVTGHDLVQWQIRIASNEPLDFDQSAVRLTGHAIECRITSEDAFAGFLPSTGRIERLDVPSGPGVRWDGGVAEGSDISLFYDPLLAKLIVHAPHRTAAIDRMHGALRELRLIGVETSAELLQRVMQEPDFRDGRIDIRYLEQHANLLVRGGDEETMRVAAIAAAMLERETRKRRAARRIDASPSQDRGWRGRGWSDRTSRDRGWRP